MWLDVIQQEISVGPYRPKYKQKLVMRKGSKKEATKNPLKIV